MDNIQFWIYVIFAVIYFLSRSLRKKPAENQQKRPRSPLETDEGPRRQPASFEELLEEITGRQTLKEPPREVEEEESFTPVTPKKKEPAPPPFDEGRTRRFSDEESRRIYEESIKNAEGFDLDYKPDAKFASRKVLRATAEEEEVNEFASEIRSTLQNPESAKKAIILAEIINRKY